MSIAFNWFKNYVIVSDNCHCGLGEYTEYSLECIDSDSTSFSAGNVIELDNIFEKYLNINIPVISTNNVTEDYKPDLIEPKRLSELCKYLLKRHSLELGDLRDRVEWIKKISDEGYYVGYESGY
jgi:hypothetical protein